MGCITAKTIGRTCLNTRRNYEKHSVDNMLKSIANIFLPQFCINCKKAGGSICPACLEKLDTEKIDFPICLVCENLCTNGRTHKICSSHTPISAYLADYFYNDITMKAMRVKSKNSAPTLELLRMAVNIQKLKNCHIEAIIPAPTSTRFLNPRTINPVQNIANYIGSALNLPIYDLLYKSVFSKHQKALDKEQRRSPNIFIKKGGWHLIKKKNLLLVDDVCTTGATLNASARRLKQFGAETVTAYTLVRDLRYNKA